MITRVLGGDIVPVKSVRTATSLVAALSCVAWPALAQGQPDALAKAFGARETVISASLAPDGSKIALIAAGPGRTTRAFVLDAVEGAEPKSLAQTGGKPEYLQYCNWAASDRLACQIAGQTRYVDHVYGFSTLFAVDAAGGNIKQLSQRRGENAQGYDFRGGEIVDLLAGEQGSVLMTRSYVPEGKIGSLVEKRQEGLGVDRVDTRTGATKRIEQPRPNAFHYVSDGRGTVRIMGNFERDLTGYQKSRLTFLYRATGKADWSNLSTYDTLTQEGFYPLGIDADNNIAYGYKKIAGRDALVSVALDAGLEMKTVFAHPRVDIGGLILVGRNRRPVGVSYVEEHRQAFYFDPTVAAMTKSLSKALDGKKVHIGDMSVDGQKMLVWAGSDTDPGQYYLYDKAVRKLAPIMPDRPELAGKTLSPMQSVSFKAADGTMIPAYLTLPPEQGNAKGLPAIVLPHGGPESRDEWGFDWLVQYYAARGFAVIQPQFRGSDGFGDDWVLRNGYQSWRTSVSDVIDAGRWLVAQGIADPAKLTIAGWSYGGYAALQAQALDPALFKAIVAIAPVTDFADRHRRSQQWSNYYLQQQRMGTGKAADEASPSSYAAEFRAPVLMFHGTDDANVDISQAKIMQGKLEGAGKRSQLVVYDGLTHNLDDSDARADMLQKSADFLLAAGK
ncbi:MAG: S9 family peptidase [Sphingomonadaceae bacterium]|nr:S9 family peptidase [Sphingomonadaceae bacterium]